MATGAYTGNPNIARQGARARQIAQARNVSDIADPRTYGFMQGLLGSAPDQLGYSVFDDPETRRAAQQAAEVGLVGGGLLQSIPVLGPALKGYGRLAAGQVNRAMMGEGGLLGPITPQPMYVVPPSIAGGKNPIKSAVVLVGDKIFTGRTHGDALNRAVYEGAVRKEGGKYIYPKDAEVNSDLFMTNSGQIIDRLQASKMFDIGASETAIEKGLMQNKPSGSMTIDQYMEQAQQIKKQREQPSFQYPQQAALDLAQQRAALPVDQGGLGLPARNTPEMRAKSMNYTKEMFHETSGKKIEDGLLGFDVKRVGAAASDEQTPYAMFLKPHGENIGVAKNQPSQMPVLVKSDLTDENILRSFGNREELQNYLNQFPEIKEATQAVRKLDNKMADYINGISKKSDELYAQGKTAEAEKLLDSTNINSNLMKEFDARTNELAALSKQKITDLFKSQGIGTVGLTNDTGAFGRKTITEMVLNPTENVRSRFAAFDPFRKDVATATAMGVALPDLLAAEPTPQPQSSGLLYPFP